MDSFDPANGNILTDLESFSLFDLLRYAIELRDSGQINIARDFLKSVISRHHSRAEPYFEIAFVERLCGNHQEAIGWLNLAHEKAPLDDRIELFRAHMLFSLGCHAEGKEVLAHLSVNGSCRPIDIEVMRQFGEYIKEYPLTRSQYIQNNIKHHIGYLDHVTVYELISNHIAERKPFALVRLGDGEGAHITVSSSDERQYDLLYNQNRLEMQEIWFGKNFPHKMQFERQIRINFESLAECDVIGISPDNLLKHEYAISSLRGIPSLTNTIRYLFDLRQDFCGKVCSQYIKIDLLRENLLQTLLRNQTSIGIVTCHKDLGDLMKNYFGINEIETYLVPGEKSRVSQLGIEQDQTYHFPYIYEETEKLLSKTHYGKLFLVAAGILGKKYVITIKRHGGIALDIGSVVDAWLGKFTRSEHNEAMVLRPRLS